jgi:ankyrin repeat protein
MIRDERRVRTIVAIGCRGDPGSSSRRLPVALVLLSIAIPGCGASPAPSADPVHPARLSDADWSQALAGGDLSAVRAELERSPERASIAMAGSYPLHLAAESGNEALIDCLVDAGADPDCRDPLRCTPLYGAAGAGAPKTLRRLIEKGADVDARDAIGATPLASTVLSRNLECFEILLDAGATVERVHPIATLLSIAVMADADEFVLPIIEAGIDVDSLDLQRHSALHTATTLGRTEIVRTLLEAGADTSLRTPLGETPLILAARGLGPTFLQDQLLPQLNMSLAVRWLE